ncbi:MAG TPA: hypothetical protein VL418_11460 [Devosiaceae bacterium]|nr:hypothetical protein [Devosiaceae bacterium]
MSSFNLLFRAGLVAFSIAGGAALSGCTMTPAFNDNAAVSAMALGFAAPTNPQEQIVYQDLTRRFGTSSDPHAPQVSVAVTTASRTLAQSTTTDPTSSQLMTATGIIKITKDGDNILTATRQATSTYTNDNQVLADTSASSNAADQAAHALADTLELTIISALAPTAAASQ